MFGSSRKSDTTAQRDHASGPSEDPSARESAEAFRRELEIHLRARAELAGIEAKEAGEILARKSVLGICAGAAAFFCYALFLTATVSLLGRWLEQRWPDPLGEIGWPIAALILSGLHLPLILILLTKVKRKPVNPLFEYTRAEFRKDREWLDQKQNPS